jgi:hypothetical protein
LFRLIKAKNPYKNNIPFPILKNKELKFSILLSRSDDKRNDDENAAIKITKYPHLAAFFPKVTIK